MDEHDLWSERLSEYLDGDLTADETRACAEHVGRCDTCAALLAELERVALAARALPAPAPERDLWPGIAARLEPRGEGATTREPRVLDLGGSAPWWRRRLTISLPQALAASLLLVGLAGGASWLALRAMTPGVGAGRPLASAPTGPRASTPGAASSETAIQPAAGGATRMAFAAVDPRYDRTVADLQRLFVTERAHLDTSTVRILDQNLAIIDRAVSDAQHAVESDPSNAYLRSHLAATMRRKVELLRRATVIASTQG